VVHEGSNDLYVIDTGTSTVMATVPVGRKPIRVVVSR
jgi:YVTN family beta-propeller protein